MDSTTASVASKPSLKETITALAGDFKPLVTEIEASIKTTQDHYGRYMAVISGLSKGNEKVAKIISLALMEAGANPNGVRSARHVLFGAFL